jgi:hypothetical protein
MKHKQATKEEPLCVLIEGAAQNDAAFYGRWLTAAAEANEILDEALGLDDQQVVVCKLGYEIDLGHTAMYVVEKLLRQGGATCIIADDIVGEQMIAEQMAIMTELGFYTRFENRYQLTIPRKVDIDSIKQAVNALIETEDSYDTVNAKNLFATRPLSEALAWQELASMDQEKRLLRRKALLRGTLH